MKCPWCGRKVDRHHLTQHQVGCSAAPLPGAIHDDCGGTIVPYDGKTWRCLRCGTRWKTIRIRKLLERTA